MRGQIRWTEKSVPYHRPGLGMALWGFCVLLLVWTFKATVLVAKWTAIAVAAVVAVIVGWVNSRRAS